MAFNTKKADFIKMISDMKNPCTFSRHGSVYLRDGGAFDGGESTEIYRASNMQESGMISATNQASKFNRWIGR